MKNHNTILLLLFLSLFASPIVDGQVKSLEVLGVHWLRIPGNEEVQSGWFSPETLGIPLLKKRVGHGQLLEVDLATGIVKDRHGVFSKLDKNKRYYIITRTGPCNLYPIIPPAPDEEYSDNPNQIKLDMSLSPNVLTKDTWFTVHPMYSFNELFPIDGSVLPKNKFDVLAGQIHILEDGRKFTKYWLSDGTLTEKAGWVRVKDGVSEMADDYFLLPGVGFTLYLPEPRIEVFKFAITGEIASGLELKTIKPGHNYLFRLYATTVYDSLLGKGYHVFNDTEELETWNPASY